MVTRTSEVCLAMILASLLALWLLLRGVSRLDHDVLPTDDAQPQQPPEPASVSQDWLDHIQAHRFVECAFTDAEGCRECGWLAMFGIVTERMMTGRVHRVPRRGGA
jgi:hypothetical protein